MPDNWMLYAFIALAVLNLILIVLTIVISRSIADLRGMLNEQRALLKSAVNGFLTGAQEDERRHYEILGAVNKGAASAARQTPAPQVSAGDGEEYELLMDVLSKLARLSGKVDKLAESCGSEETRYKAAMFDKLTTLVESGADKAAIVRALKSGV